MKHSMMILFAVAASAVTVAEAQSPGSCANLTGLKLDRVEIIKAELVPAGTTVPAPYPSAPAIGPLPAHCRVDGIINRGKGIDGRQNQKPLSRKNHSSNRSSAGLVVANAQSGKLRMRRNMESRLAQPLPWNRLCRHLFL
jgi:hypothetical protein